MVKTKKRYSKKRKTIRKKCYKNKNLSKKQGFQLGGNRCSKQPDILQIYDIIWDKLINYWHENWKFDETDSDILDTFEPKDKARYRERIKHHPVVLNILRSHFADDLEHGKETILNNILQLYCGNWSIKLPEYSFIMYTLYHEHEVDIKRANISGIIKKFGEEHFNTKSGNKLQPQNWQILILHYFINHPLYKKMNELQRPDHDFPKQQKWEQYLRLFSGDTPFINVHELGSGHEDDLDARAGIIAERCIRNTNLNKLYTMDGHGRFICSFLIQLFHRDPKFFIRRDFNIYVCDIDKEVNLWHRTTMPNGVTVNRDIFEILEETIDSRSAEIEKTLIYANFSGAAGQRELIETAFGTYNLMNCLDNIVVSVANVRGAIPEITRMIANIKSTSDKINTNLTGRTVFPTIGTEIGVGIGEYSTIVWENPI
jgi:hypothetical protein